MRLGPVLLLLTGCVGSPPSIESDLEALARAHKRPFPPPTELPDGSVMLDAAFVAGWNSSRRLESLSADAIPGIFRLARANPRLTCPALQTIGRMLHLLHDGPFSIPRASGEPPYWVIRWPTGEGKIVLDCRSVAEEREDALSAFERWLSARGYVLGR